MILLILNTNSKAEEWDDLIEVESEIDGFCYFTKMIKPEEEYNLEFESTRTTSPLAYASCVIPLYSA